MRGNDVLRKGAMPVRTWASAQWRNGKISRMAASAFDWDEANAHKNWERQQVTWDEFEDVFFNEPLVVRGDSRHSRQEKRYYVLGHTGRGAFIRRLHHPTEIDSGDLSSGHESQRGGVLWQARRNKFLSFVPKQPNAPFGLSTIRPISSTGKPPKGAGSESETVTHDLPTPASVDDRRSENAGPQTGRSLSVFAKGISR